MAKYNLFIEKQGDEWLVFEWAGAEEYIRGRYATEIEASIRVAELQSRNRRPEPLIVEEITEDPPPPRPKSYPSQPRYLKVIPNEAEQKYLVVGGQNNHDVTVLGKFDSKPKAMRFVRDSWGAHARLRRY